MRERIFIIIILYAIGISYGAKCQSVNLDSLRMECYKIPLTEAALNACFEVALSEQYNNADSAEFYFHLSIENSTRINPDLKVDFLIEYAYYLMKIKSLYQKADSILQVGIDLEIKRARRPKQLLNLYKWRSLTKANLGNVDEGKLLLKKAESLLEKHNFSNKEKGDFYNDFSEFYGFTGDLEKFTETILKAIEFYNENGDVNDVAMGFLNISIKHIENNQFAKAKMFGNKSLEILQILENDFLLGHNYTILMVSNSELNHPDEADQYAQKAIKIWQKLGIKRQEAGLRRNIATLHRKAEKYTEALEEINLSIAEFKKLEEPGQLIYCWAEKALIHAKRKNNSSSQTALDSMFELKYVFENNAVEWMNILKTVEEVQAENNNFQAAYSTNKEFQLLKDSINNSANLSRIEELETQYFTKEKDIALSHQNAQLQQQKYLIWLFGLLIISLLILAFIFWKNAKYRKTVNLQLRQLDNAKSRFFTNISHELRTPLTLILAPLESALEKVTSKPIKDNLHLAHSNSKKLLILVNEIMDLSKLESGKMVPKETNLDLEKLLRRIFYSYHSLAQLRGFILSFSYHLPKDIGVLIDAEKLERVLNNLLSNAFKYSHPGGVITLRVSDDYNATSENSISWMNRKMLKI